VTTALGLPDGESYTQLYLSTPVVDTIPYVPGFRLTKYYNFSYPGGSGFKVGVSAGARGAVALLG
jgi:hypothetical protein